MNTIDLILHTVYIFVNSYLRIIILSKVILITQKLLIIIFIQVHQHFQENNQLNYVAKYKFAV